MLKTTVRKTLLMTMLLLSASCSIVTVERFVHKDTAEILNTFYWTADKRTLLELVGEDLVQPILVPDFTGANTLTLRVIASEAEQIHIERYGLQPDSAAAPVERSVSRDTSPRQTSQGLWLTTITLPVGRTNAFTGVDKLKLTVVWKYGSSEESTASIFELIRTSRRDVAWVT